MLALFGNDPPQEPVWVRRLDVRTKMAISISASLAVMVLSQPWSLGLLVMASGLYALALRRFKLVLICYGAVLFLGGMAVLFMHGLHWVWPKASATRYPDLVVPFLRTGVMINVMLALALSSNIQSILTALKSLRLPFCIYIPAAVMVRFIPDFIEDVRQIAETVRIRGYRLTPWLLGRRPLLAVRLLLAPILFRALRTSDELGMAAELKGIGYSRTLSPYKSAHFGKLDVGAGLAALLLVAAALAVQLVFPAASGVRI